MVELGAEPGLVLMSADLERLFPGLADASYTITSPPSDAYNCIAWAAKDLTKVWWPDRLGLYFWPAERSETLEVFVRVFEKLGYQSCDNSDLEVGSEKVAIFCKDGVPTHMARQLEDGSWTSKCGRLEDITHELHAVGGTHYGEVAAVMKCRIS